MNQRKKISNGLKTDDPVPFSEFGLKGSKDRYLRCVLRSLGGNPRPGFYNYDTLWLAEIWQSDLHSRWDSLRFDVKSRLVADLLDALYQREGAFDALFAVLFHQSDRVDIWRGKNYSSTAVDILGSFGLEHSFPRDGWLQNILDFPLKNLLRMSDPDGLHPLPCESECLCRSIGRPLYVAFFCGRPDMVRVLLNCGASLLPEEVCSFNHVAGHPLSFVAPTVFSNGDESRRPLDLLSLQLLLVDAPQALRGILRSTFCHALEEIPSLKHAARACVRRHLRASRTICRPGALRPCGLPKCLEAYIYMEDAVVDS